MQSGVDMSIHYTWETNKLLLLLLLLQGCYEEHERCGD